MSGAEVSEVGLAERRAYHGGRTEFVKFSRAKILVRRALTLPVYRIGGRLVRDGRTFRRLLSEAAAAANDFSSIKSGEVIDFGRITERRVFYDISSSYPAAMLRGRP